MNLEAEQNLLGMAMIDQNCAIKLLEIPENWFLLNQHKLIYREINTLISKSLSIDSTALGNNLLGTSESKNGLDMTYLMTLESDCSPLAHFDSWKARLFTIYKKNSIKKVADSLNRQLDSGEDVTNIITGLQDSVFDLLTDHNESKPEPINHYMAQVIEELQWQHDNPNLMAGKQSGFKQLDETINGFEAGKVYVIGGRPGMGKTQFALNLGLRISKNDDTLIFSLEMTGKGLAKRALSNVSNLDGRKINGATLVEDDWTAIAQGMAVVKDQNKIFIDETPNLSTAQMRARLKAHELKYGNVGCIIVDHIGLIKKNPKKNEREALTQISHELQAMSKEFKAPLIELVQLNRGVESGEDKRPQLKSIKETSAIEEDARVIMFPYRDEYYNEDSEMRGITELIIAKNSDGETKSIYFKSDMARARYESHETFIKPEPKQKSIGKFK